MTKESKQMRAAIYVRVSTEEQRNGFSLEAQETLVKEYARQKGYEVYPTAIYIDGGYSGKNFNRPEIQRLLRDVREDKYDAVISWKVDRISRSNKDVLTFIDHELHSRGAKLLITTCDIDSSTTNGYMFISLLGTFAEYERTVIIERVNSGMTKRAEKGLYNGGKILGYDAVDKELVINEQESALVQKIFELRSEGKGYKSIVNIINGQDYKTKNNNKFTVTAIRDILHRKAYIGQIKWGEMRNWDTKRRSGKTTPILAEGSHNAIIHKDLWDKVQEVNKVQKEKQIYTSNFKGEFFLAGVLRCPECGAGTVMSKRRKRDGSGYHLYYMCQNYHSKGKTACSSNLIKKEIVEEKVIKVIKGLLNNNQVVEELLSKLNDEFSNSVGDVTDQITRLKSNLNKEKRYLDQIKRDYKDGELTARRYEEDRNEIESEIERIMKEMSQLELHIQKSNKMSFSKALIQEALSNFIPLYEDAANGEKRQLIRALIKTIEMESNRTDIKSIVFWFSEHNAFTPALPDNELWRTVS